MFKLYSHQRMTIIDLTDFSSVVAFADWAECELGRLNILVRNAGMVRASRGLQEKVRGIFYDLTRTNHFS